jgi:hypothetical protein
MSLIASSAGCFSGPDFCLIFAPCGYDDPEILPKRKPPTVSKALTADKAGCALARLVRRADALVTRLCHMPERVARAMSSSSNSMSPGVGTAHRRGGCSLMICADLLAFIIRTDQGSSAP